jgi:hypothetical protein
MNTGIRRFILRLAVGLLAFLLGISAAWALGGFNPFQSSSGESYDRHQRYGSHRSLDMQPEPAYIYPTYHKHDRCRAHGSLDELPPPPPPMADGDAPLPPSPPPAMR